MQKRRIPILQKVSNLFKTSIFTAKMRKPIVAKLVFLKKSRKVKRLKLPKHYNNYGFLKEYQFSPSSTPLIHYHKRVNYLKNVKSFQDFNSMLFFCKCFRGSAEAAGYSSPLWKVETLPPASVNDGEVLELEPLALEDEEDDDSVDQRAEKFIEWFYQEMRMQRQDSF